MVNTTLRTTDSSSRIHRAMRIRLLVPALLLVASGCNSILDTTPKDTIPEATAISDAPSARAALAGMYTSLQSLSSYGETLIEFGDLSADNAENTGTYTSYLEADLNQLRSNNASIFDIWTSAYDGINRANEIITKVPAVTGLDDTEKAEIMGEAYFVRALDYHNLVKLFGGVPIRTQPTASVSDVGNATRASVPEVYTQILKDLDSAAAFITNTEPTTQATVGAVAALRARVLLYAGDYPGAQAAAEAVEAMDYDLSSNYGDLFPTTGQANVEDIFKVDASLTQENFLSYDYLNVYELGPTLSLMHAYDPAFNPATSDIEDYNPTDTRGRWNILVDDGTVYGNKYRSIVGTENVPVIRFAEVILIRAEALARQSQLPQAVTELQRIQTRANATLFVLGTHTQQDVIDAITAERQKEFAFEGDRWPDLVRLGTAATVLGIDPNQTLYPIPAREIAVSPTLTQNPGY
jgi:starch-binding outer membrane protein, SusD/RagB family